MPSNGAGQATRAVDQIKDTVTESSRKAVEGVNEQRRTVAHAIDRASETVERHSKQLPNPLSEYAEDATDGLKAAAKYVRKHDATDMAEDLRDVVQENPLVTLLVIGGVIVAGSVLMNLLSQGEDRQTNSEAREPLFASALQGLGPKTNETVMRMRDAAFNLILAKAVNTLEEAFPGFREHFEKA